MSKASKFGLLIVLLSTAALANQGVTIPCTAGAQVAVTQGINSTTKVFAAFPSCLVTVFDHGTINKSTIYSDNLTPPTALSNPFSSSSITGLGQFFAANGRYDVVVSGAGITNPLTYNDISLFDSVQLPNTLCSALSFSASLSFNVTGCGSFPSLTLTGNVTTSAITGGTNGQTVNFSFCQDVTGSRTLAWPASFTNPPVMTSTASKCEQFTFQLQADALWHNQAVGEFPINQIASLTGTGNQGVLSQSPVIFQPTLSGVLPGATFLSISASSYNGLARIVIDPTVTGGYATWAAALAACPAAGCILDATSPNTPRAMGTFDVGTKQVKVEFGPFSNFTAVQITLRAGLWLQGLSGATNATVITSAGTNAQQLLTTPQTTGTQVFNFKVDGIRFIALPGNTSQEGLLSDVSGCTNCNLNYGVFSNLWFLNFVGSSIHLKGRTVDANAANQFLLFQNVNALRPSGTNPVLKIEGYAGQISFIQDEFDGASNNDGGDNIYLGSGGGTNTQSPNTIFFDNLTSQAGSVNVHCDGCNGVDIRGLHSEGTPGVLLVSNSSSGIGNGVNTVHLHHSFIVATSATGGSGYVVNVTDPNSSGSRVVVEDNLFGGNPDNVEKCANTNSCVVLARNNIAVVSPSAAATTSNITPVQAPAATLDIKSWNHIYLTSSATGIATLRGNQLPGELVTFVVSSGTASFVTGGNLGLGSNASPLVCSAGDSVTFLRVDQIPNWQLQASSPGCTNAIDIAGTVINAITGTGKAVLDTSPTIATANLTGLTPLSGNRVQVAADFTTANNANLQTITGLVFNLPATAKNYSIHCYLVYSQATANVAVAFGIQAVTNNPTNIFGMGQEGTSLTALTTGTLRTLATTTATNIVSATPSAFGAIGTAADMFNVLLDVTVEEPALSNVINIMVSTANGADAVTVYKDSACVIW